MTTLLSTWSSHLPPRVGARGAIRERWFKLSLALGAFCVCAAGCTETHGGRPTVMCGTMVNPGGPGAFIVDEVPTDSPSAGSSTVRVDANTLILVATGCGTGADVTFSRPDVTMGPVAYAKDGKPVIFGLSSAISPQDVVMTVTAHRHTRTIRLSVVGSSTVGDSQTAGYPSATRDP